MNLQLQKVTYFFVLTSVLYTPIFSQSSASLSQKYPKNSKVLYKTIPIKKEIGTVIVAIGGKQDFQYEHWEGDAILVEQEIHLENAPNSVFKELLRKKRYTISEYFKDNTLTLKYEAKDDKDLLVNYKNVNEKVFLKLLIPEKMDVELHQ